MPQAPPQVGVIAQRLARRICRQCDGKGCQSCDAGLHGRTGIYEVLVTDDTIRARILRRAPAHVIRAAARAGGMRTLGEDARRLVDAGITTETEVGALLAIG